MTLSEIDIIRIRHLVEDHAGNFVGGSMDLGPSDAVRYMVDVVENTYSGLARDAVRAAVTAIIDEDPAILNKRTTERDRVAAELRRHAAAQEWMTEASEALRAAEPWSPRRHDYDEDGPHPYVVACIDAAEREYPDMATLAMTRDAIADRWLGWRVRQIVSRAMRATHGGSQRGGMEILDAGAAAFPDAADWDLHRRKVRDYHLPLVT